VGVNVRLMVFNATGERGAGEELLLANPRIVSSGRGHDVHEARPQPPPLTPLKHW